MSKHYAGWSIDFDATLAAQAELKGSQVIVTGSETTSSRLPVVRGWLLGAVEWFDGTRGHGGWLKVWATATATATSLGILRDEALTALRETRPNAYRFTDSASWRAYGSRVCKQCWETAEALGGVRQGCSNGCTSETVADALRLERSAAFDDRGEPGSSAHSHGGVDRHTVGTQRWRYGSPNARPRPGRIDLRWVRGCDDNRLARSLGCMLAGRVGT